MPALLPFDQAAAGTNQISVPFNDNAHRADVLAARVISKTTTAQPGSPAERDLYIIPASATGAQWATFAVGSLAYFRGGTWYEYPPFNGLIKVVGSEFERWTGSAWTNASGAPLRDAVTALSISSGVVTIDCSLGDYFTLSLTASVTSIVFTNLPASGRAATLSIRITQDATGGRTVALPSSFKASGGSDTAVQSAANARTLLTITTFDQGTRWEYAMQELAA